MRSGIRSATPLMLMPAKLCPTSTTLCRSCAVRKSVMSWMNVSRLMSLESKSAFSPTPVWVGVKTSKPCAISKGTNLRQHHAPCQAPCTKTMGEFMLGMDCSSGLSSGLADFQAIARHVRMASNKHTRLSSPFWPCRNSYHWIFDPYQTWYKKNK